MPEPDPPIPSPERCPMCSMPLRVVYVHGHGQCAACGQNIQPCCQPEEWPEEARATSDESREKEDGPCALKASVLKHVPHGFSTRLGGVSHGVFASLNFGNPGELPANERDPIANIAENYRRLLDAADAPGRLIHEVHQVHGGAVHIVRDDARTTPDPKADAMVTSNPRVMLAIRTADCVPILFASGNGCIVGAAHAGWRGIIAGVVPATLDAMRSLGATEIVAAIGPCISGEAFEVGEEVAAEFERVFKPETLVVLRRAMWPKPHVDLKRAIFLQLAASGAAGAQVFPNCTVNEPRLFFSHRREGGRTGRMASVIGPVG